MTFAQFISQTSAILESEPPNASLGQSEAAAVLALIGQIDGEAAFGLTVRQKTLPQHPGQIAFPGGRMEDGESVAEAALRETEEEIGVSKNVIDVVGYLMPQIVPTGYIVWPVVGILSKPVEIKLQAEEVSDFFWAPVDYFMNQANRTKLKWLIPGEKTARAAYYFNNFEIWGMTLRIIETLTVTESLARRGRRG